MQQVTERRGAEGGQARACPPLSSRVQTGIWSQTCTATFGMPIELRSTVRWAISLHAL